MRACWIDTSSMFRTLRGFFETAKMTQHRIPDAPLDFTAAKSWAKEGAVEIVPALSAK